MGITIESYRANIGIFNNKPYRIKITMKTTDTHYQSTFNKNLKIYTLLCFFLFFTQINNYSQIQQAHNNKLTHSINGNIKYNNIKIAHFNKGNSKFDNKIDDIHYIIDKHKPLIFSISEANYCNINKTQISDYNIEVCDFKIGYHTSRQVLLIHNSLTYTRRHDLEKPYIALIICDIKINKKDTLTIAAYYRQWSLPKDIGAH